MVSQHYGVLGVWDAVCIGSNCHRPLDWLRNGTQAKLQSTSSQFIVVETFQDLRVFRVGVAAGGGGVVVVSPWWSKSQLPGPGSEVRSLKAPKRPRNLGSQRFFCVTALQRP